VKVLLLSFYFPPDLSAGSFRNAALVDSLRRKLPSDSKIDVLTTLPNRYSGFNVAAKRVEEYGVVKIIRTPLPAHKSGIFDQARSFLAYCRFVRRHLSAERYDVVVASSSRLMTAALGAWASKKMNVPLYLDVRDIFVDTIKDVFPSGFSRLLEVVFSRLEHWTILSADRLNVVSAGFLPYFDERYPSVPKVVFTNGIDDIFISMDKEADNESLKTSRESVINVLYAGNMGEGQGLHSIIPSLAKTLEGKVFFHLIGDGGRKKQLEAAVSESGCQNVNILPPVSRQVLIDAYRDADVLFLHLNDYPAFRKVLPSKLFEYGALGKPIWAGVAGYAADFVAAELSNSALFSPCDVLDAVKAFSTLEIKDAPRASFVEKFKRDNIMDDMADDILRLVRGANG